MGAQGKIFINGLKIRACHGVLASEKVTPQTFIFDVELSRDPCAAGFSDSLKSTVNYSEVCALVTKIATQNTYDLIEKLAFECALQILENFPVSGAKVTVKKPEAPVPAQFSYMAAQAELSWETVYLSLGSSMGDRKNFMNAALSLLSKERGVRLVKSSSVIETPPYGGVAKNAFLNCAAQIQTCLSPKALLEVCHRVENACHRVRTEKWGDRTLDIDIIFYGREIICEEGLIIPHPEYQKRDFVLTPLKELAPDFVCPVLHKRIRDL